jgi:hypothetical protein
LVSAPDEDFTGGGLCSSVKSTTDNFVNLNIYFAQTGNQQGRIAKLNVAVIYAKLAVFIIAKSKNMA